MRPSRNLICGRKFADGTDYYTLPVLTDSTSSSNLGDSFDIAVYLQKTYPNTGAGNLLPEQKLDYIYGHDLAVFAPLSELNGNEHADYARFNMNVDAAFSAHVLLMVHGLPFNPDTAEETKAEFVRRSGVASWDDLTVRGEKRDEMKKSLHDTLKTIAELFQRNKTGPFLLGEQPNYADLIVGAWLQMMHETLPAEEWDEVKTWHEGVFGNLHNALQKYALVN